MNRKISLVINKSEITAGTRGASLGPEAIMTAARASENTFFCNYPKRHVKDMNEMLDAEVKFPTAKRIKGLCSYPLSIKFLQIPGSNIIDNCITLDKIIPFANPEGRCPGITGCCVIAGHLFNNRGNGNHFRQCRHFFKVQSTHLYGNNFFLAQV